MKAISSHQGWVRRVRLGVDPPSLRDNTADVDRLLLGLRKVLGAEKVTLDLPLVRRIPALVREYGYAGAALVHEKGEGVWHLMDFHPPSLESPVLGMAVDLGTTTVVVRLLDLGTGEIQGEGSFLNPQVSMGADILSRIHYASGPGGLAELQQAVIQKLNLETGRLCHALGMRLDQVVAASVAGNTTMTHLFLGLDPFRLCREPYTPVLNSPDLFGAGELGMDIHPGAPVLVFPNVGSYFGGDLIAGILASGMHRDEALSILVDVGTNAEVVLGNRDWLVGCAGAAGPALEGGVASMGMMAGPGVIERVIMDPRTGELRVGTIQNMPPVGICGSGLIDLTARLFEAGMIDVRGKFFPGRCGSHLVDVEGASHFVVVGAGDSGTGEDLTLGQTDLDALLRSKAAMYTILTTITGMVHVSLNQITRFYTAGTFGYHIDPRAAITIGMLPDLPLETYRPLGNTSLEGATLALLSSGVRKEIREIRSRVTYVELNVNREFMELFSGARFIPHTDRALFPSVKG